MIYLASPRNQMQAHAIRELPVLFSYACWSPWIENFQASYTNILVDSGAFSELNSGVKVDLEAYKDWSQMWLSRADAIAGLDDIGGNWKRSLKNYDALEWGFPTFHDSDPADHLPDLIDIAHARNNWLGIGLTPPRAGRGDFIQRTLEEIPDDIHVHLWAGRQYKYISRINSIDSTNWFRDAMALKQRMGLSFLTLAECTDLVVLRYKREERHLKEHVRQHRLL